MLKLTMKPIQSAIKLYPTKVSVASGDPIREEKFLRPIEDYLPLEIAVRPKH